MAALVESLLPKARAIGLVKGKQKSRGKRYNVFIKESLAIVFPDHYSTTSDKKEIIYSKLNRVRGPKVVISFYIVCESRPWLFVRPFCSKPFTCKNHALRTSSSGLLKDIGIASPYPSLMSSKGSAVV
jgi:hypothetical protein